MGGVGGVQPLSTREINGRRFGHGKLLAKSTPILGCLPPGGSCSGKLRPEV